MRPAHVALALFLAIGATGCGLLPGREAPDECGFPEGTALEFAGRSTTSALGVQEVVGDVMSVEPADIYITREEFAQGDLQGRLVCAIYVNQPGFIEVTVHPGDLPVVAEEPEPPAAPRPADGISRLEATEVALDEVAEAGEVWAVAAAEAGPAREMIYDPDSADWWRDLPPERWVWRIFLVSGDKGREVFVDYVDGTVLGVLSNIVN